MTERLSGLASLAARYLDSHPTIRPVAPKTATSMRRHLAVYQTDNGCPIGVELDHDTLVNAWVPRDWVAVARLLGIQRTLKTWIGRPNAPWQGSDGKGANSNLRSYDTFQGYDLVRFRITSEEELHLVMAEVLR